LPDTKVDYFAAIILDISDLKKAEEDLRKKNSELELINRFAVDREIKMIELKKQINDLSVQLGKAMPYNLGFLDAEKTGGEMNKIQN
jgi:hypothetical protein